MIYLNLKTSTLRSPAYVGAEPVQRATWLSLLAYCCEQENGGRIEAAGAWRCRQWQQTCGVTLAEINDECGLWHRDGDALVVEFYPADKQAEVQAKREAGRRGGQKTSEAKAQANREHGFKPSEAELEALRQAELEAELEASGKHAANGKERKGRGIGKEGTDAGASEAGHSPLVPPEEKPKTANPPPLAEWLSRCNLAGISKDHAEEIWHDNEGRGYGPEGHWLDYNGRPIANPLANAKSRSLAMQGRRRSQAKSGNSNTNPLRNGGIPSL